MFDVRNRACGVDDVLRYLHPLDDRRAESLASQQRLARKWARDRGALHARTRLDPEQVDARQLELVARLVDSAFATVPFYQELYRSAGYRSGDIVTWADYNALPTISKDDILANFERFVASRALAPNECYSSRTSGSSGRTLTILQDDAASDIGALYYLRHYEEMLGRERLPDEWVYEVYLAPPRYSSLDGAFPTFTLSQDCPVDLAAQHLLRFRPALLTGFPSYFLRLADAYPDLRGASVRAICTNSESSTPAEREKISQAFGAPCHDEYSSEELYLIATQCPHRRYHVVEDNVRVDILNPDGTGLGDVVATSIVNQYMPFIRYRQGDVVRMGRSGCECGNRFRTLDAFMGRADQFLRGAGFRKIAPDRVMALYDRTLIPSSAGIAEFRISQGELGVVALHIVPDAGGPNPQAITDFTVGLRELFDDPALELKVHASHAAPKGLSHKRRLISCTIAVPGGQGG